MTVRKSGEPGINAQDGTLQNVTGRRFRLAGVFADYKGNTPWIAASLRTMQTIKPGMTRSDLLKVFKTEGGISNRLQRTYVFPRLPLYQG